MKKTVLITGAARGIGFTIAKRLIKDGYRIAISDLNSDAVAEAVAQLGGDTYGIAFDISDVTATREAVRTVAETCDGLYGLVNNAGIFKSGALLDVTESDYDALHDINLRGAFFALQESAKIMLADLAINPQDGPTATAQAAKAGAQTKGVIVNIASAAGRGGRPTQTIYGMTKAGLVHLAWSAAQAFAPYIRVYSVCPAAIESAMWQQTVSERLALGGQEAVDAFMSRIPMGRAGTQDEVAGVVSFLFSDDAAFMTGSALDVSGGLHMA